MRPLRLLLDGFGSYRQPTTIDFSDVDFFALIGPTGSGKSTVIDGLCFALYGTVPRWGKTNVITEALAPATAKCEVCLVFESAGRRYAAIRLLTRDNKGQVHTKDARLERLDEAVPPDAPLAGLLAASVEQIAEGPDGVTSQVQGILGLTYEHFTQSVLLPQGQFERFLRANAAKRQDLLVELLAFGVYDQVGQRARSRAGLAAQQRQLAQDNLAELADATEDAETRAAARLADLTSLETAVHRAVAELGQLQDQAGAAARLATEVRQETDTLAGIRTPAKVPGLAQRIADAQELVIRREQARRDAESAEEAAQLARRTLPDLGQTQAFSRAYADHVSLSAELAEKEESLARQREELESGDAELRETERALEHAHEAHSISERSHVAAAMANHLRVGETCPVCLRRVASLPDHPVPVDLAEAAKAVATVAAELKRRQTALTSVQRTVDRTAAEKASLERRLEENAVTLAGAPGESDVERDLQAIAAAEDALREASAELRTRRRDLESAGKAREALRADEDKAWASFRAARDEVVALGVPAIEDRDLAAAWERLTAWTKQQASERSSRQPDLDAAAQLLGRRAMDKTNELTRLLSDHGISEGVPPDQAAAAVAEQRANAGSEVREIRQKREKADALGRQVRKWGEEEKVAAELGRLLRATSFERWLLGEALDSLVTEASQTLMELTGNQYQLDRDERNELVVIDFADAGARRRVSTLSGGETFQASLALALALSHQVVGLSAGRRDLNSIFLDEGFGTLDADTLETVAATLEQLAAGSERMVGVVTHVPALAERVPVRFVVSRNGGTSVIRKERS
jgi:exonuclease SbcC